MLKHSLIAILFLIMLSACARNGESRQVKETVMRYNQILTECYKSLDMTPLQAVATAEHAQKVYYHMAALGEGKTRLVSALKKIDFKDITFQKPGTAAANTKEIWDFAHIGIGDDKKTLEQKDFAYEMHYELRKEGDRWLVTDARASDAGEAKKDNQKPSGGH